MARENDAPERHEIMSLPRWAQVAFAARCAERVQPLISRIPDHERRVLAGAIDLAYTAAASGGRPTRDSVHAATQALPDIERIVTRIMTRVNDAAAMSAARAAVEAAAAVRLGESPAYPAASAAAHAVDACAAWGFIHGATQDTFDRARRAMRQDFERVRDAIQERNGNDETPVPKEFFGPLWTEGAPENWPEDVRLEEKSSGTRKISGEFYEPKAALSLYFDIGELSDSDIAEILGALSDLYRGLGGDGLVIDRMTLLDPSLLPEPVGA